MGLSMLRRTVPFVAASAVFAGAALATTAVAAGGHHPHHPKHVSGRLFVSAAGTSTNSGASCAQARYSTIQSAVTAATPSSTVVVCGGTYAEDVAVSKALTLVGHDAVIDASGKDNGIVVSASHVTIEGFTVRGATGEGILAVGTADPSLVPAGSPAGSLTGVPISHLKITGNVVQGNDQGSPTSPYKECRPNGEVPGDCGEGIHLMSVADSAVSGNYVTGNSGGILLSDEFGPTHGNLIAHNVVSNNPFDCGITMPSHNGLAVNPTTLAPVPSLGGVYDNTISGNTIVDNGLKGEGAGVLIAAPFPGSASYDNLVTGNLIDGNNLSGVALHSHLPGGFIGGNKIVRNIIGVNNVGGDTPLSPSPAPPKYQADTQTTGILVWSLATPTTITIAKNTILGDAIGIWMNPTVSDPAAATSNTFSGVTTPVGP